MSFFQGLLTVLLAWAAGIAYVLLATDTPLPDALASGAGLGTAALLVLGLIALPLAFLAGGVMVIIEEVRGWLSTCAMDSAAEERPPRPPSSTDPSDRTPDHRDRGREDVSHQPHASPQRRRRR